jgi:hypothetical protein
MSVALVLIKMHLLPKPHLSTKGRSILCFLLLSPRDVDKVKDVLKSDRLKVVDKGNSVRVPLKSKVEGINPPRRQPCNGLSLNVITVIK